MLDAETKRRIDSCRDILVGKVPDPKSQVEQITIALIYKFMDDMDAEAEELGGARSFFAGEHARFGWAKLMAPSLGGYETLALYSEALQQMNQNPGVPPLFRDIFKNAYLPYRDPETLKSFLKEINYFSYDHSERLGDAFEYLLSVLGSQGDAGQFRTPRHIIDFMVEVLDPQKNETILDPACGTAGFLISAWKHILKANTRANGSSKLTPDERARLAANIHGYDISPDMVRLSLVNLYLHGFTNPRVEEYDTLTSDEKWGEVADVILANPPFMSPKGGIKPHKRFSVQATRSEVLFVDYMAEHLTATGRAAIVVPEGVIFQSGTAYKALRKMLVESSLVAVVSLPAGVFNPYSGVKTSILILDKRLHKQLDSVLFVKIANDGFNLGAQRRAVVNSDLPEATRLLRAWMTAPQRFEGDGSMAQAVGREKIGESGDFNLSGERYIAVEATDSVFPLVTLDDVCWIERGGSPRPIQDYMTDDPAGVNWIKIGDAPIDAKYITSTKERITQAGAKKSRYVQPGDFILSNSMSFGRPYILAVEGCIHDGWLLLRARNDNLLKDYLYLVLGSAKVYEQFVRSATGGVVNNLNIGLVKRVKVPLPPLEVQQQLVAEIEGYQKVIDGARLVLDNYQPGFPIDPAWPVTELSALAEFKNGLNYEADGAGPRIKIFGVSHFQDHLLAPLAELPETQVSDMVDESYLLKQGDILFVRSNGNPALVGRSVLVPATDESITFSGFTIRCRFTAEVDPYFYACLFKSALHRGLLKDAGRGASIRNLSQGMLKEIKVPHPNIDTQRAIVAEIKAEQALVNTNGELIRRMEAKIKAVIDRVWGNAQ
ncbi:N-6 DNA methylase [Roseateles toxinivorans]|uniref:site-specific DNA-methyltransferase (adenine-specific) n=1 Tax=Roseateles toxinivorans TaxID=270368 RepID=A0A4R6QMH8_9BURK|nr:N-6 DNA methylase [Roseateles toxinivorans]TDP71145.1 type I restriction enzyme M protein [Roseateles toxinivorans]